MTSLSIHQLEPFGVKLTNVDIDSSEQRDRIRALLYENGVVIIPANGASIGAEPINADESLLKLAKLFGKIENYHPVNESKDVAGRVQVLETMGNTGIPADSFLFHSDMSWRVNPSRASVLCGKVLPPSGGDTCFQSTNLMYNRLSPELKEQLHSVSALHSLKRGYARVNRPDDVKSDVKSIHPAVIRHPETGVPLLYLNPNFTVAVLGMSEPESTALLNRIFEEAIRPDQILSHSWNPGDVVIWDNLGVQHLAKADYQGLRRMHRVVAHDPHLRTERYVRNSGQVEEAKRSIEYYLKRDDNRAGYEDWAVRYEQDVNRASYNIPRTATGILAQHLGAHNNGSSPLILDVAAGTGLNALHLMRNYGLTNIEAMDISTGMLFEARRRELYRAYHEEDANQPFPMPSCQYDAVLCVGGLAANQIRPQPAISEFIRVTKEGGLVLLSMREADSEYIDEVHRLVAAGVAEVVDKHSFIGIESNQEIHHCIFVLRACGDDSSSQQATDYNKARSPFGVQEILKFIPPGDVVFDGGCGTGQHAQHLATVASRVVGIDSDAARVAIARELCSNLNNTSFEVGSITELPFEDASFDVVLLAQVLHHLGGEILEVNELRKQCQQAIKEAKRVLRTGGRLILVTTNREQRRAAYWHFNLFPQSAWERLDSVWSLTEGQWFTSVMEQLGFVAIGNATPSESHWIEAQDEQMVSRSLDPGWRSTDVAFDLLKPAELEQFVAQVEAVLADGSAMKLIEAAHAGRASHGEATVYAYELIGA
ncbi:MAG: methyltransferase domain-containing protein [Symploca sp. SIO1B1]|nr:methyltransferase domain-containing protein [Symploca sp. SIO1B1]